MKSQGILCSLAVQQPVLRHHPGTIEGRAQAPFQVLERVRMTMPNA